MKTTKEDRETIRKHFEWEIEYSAKNPAFSQRVPSSTINSDFGVKLLDDLDTLEQRLKICEEALGFYGSPESWIIRDKHAWRKSSPRSHGDDENILDYHHPNRDWVGTVAVGGKRARQALAESAKIAAADE